VHVSLPVDRTRGNTRKWHLSMSKVIRIQLYSRLRDVAAAYYSRNKVDELRTVDEIPGVGDAMVSEGWFKSARVGKVRRDSRTYSGGPHPGEIPPSSTTPPLYAYSLGSPTSHSRYIQYPNQHTISSGPSGHFSAPSSTQNHLTEHLVPLEYLKNISAPRRDPTDEQLLRRFAS